ncbi:exonuclease subunit SbcD [Citrobacter freundii]|nr:exonuclease subunit SbcD [Citrobacter freundii]
MRILHTSDWHLGQNFYSKSRAAEHQAFLDWLLETAQSHQVDAIIVAGDIFDTGSPPSYARELYNRFVVNLQQTGCHLVVLAGNHDSVATLNESRDILAFLNTTVVASAGHAPQVLSQRDGTPGAILCPVPFFTSTRHYYQPGRANRARKTATFAVSHHRLLPAAVSGCLHAAW